MTVPSRQQLQPYFNPSSWERGVGYRQQGRAVVTHVSADGTEITGTVRGGRTKPYRSSVRLALSVQGAVTLSSACDCPVGPGCKHTVALLLQAQFENTLHLPEPPRAAPTTPSASSKTTPTPKSGAAPLLSPNVGEWLKKVAAASRCLDNSYPDAVRRRLFYVLDFEPDAAPVKRVRLWIKTARLSKEGEVSENATFFTNKIDSRTVEPPLYLRPIDFSILQKLANYEDQARYALHPNGAVLAEILATGRARWGDHRGPAVRRGDEAPAAVLTWTMDAQGFHHPTPVIAAPPVGAEIHPLRLSPPWAMIRDPALPDDVVLTPLALDAPPHLLATILAAPPLRGDQAALVRERLAALWADQPLAALLPPPLAPAQRRELAMTPQLHAVVGGINRYAAYKPSLYGYAAVETLRAPMVKLSFRYGDHIAPMDGEDTMLVRDGDGRLIEIPRQLTQERAAQARLTETGLLPADKAAGWIATHNHRGCWLFPADLNGADAWFDFQTDAVPALRAAGWAIQFSDDFPHRLSVAEGPLEARLSAVGGGDEGSAVGGGDEGSAMGGVDWFEFDLGVKIDGARVDLLPSLLALLQKIPAEELHSFLDDDSDDDAPLRLTLADGRILASPFGQVRPILKALTAFLSADALTEGKARLSALDLGALHGFDDAAAAMGLPFQGGESVRALAKRLATAGAGAPQSVASPETFAGALRPYQATGVAWMQLLREVGLGGILADDMGLGKTVQTLAHLCIEQAEGRLDRPALVVAPTSLMGNWRAEAAQFAPSLRTLALHGSERKAQFERLSDYDLVFTTYPLLAFDAEILAAQDWHMLILDEAQMVKNAKTTAAKTLRRLNARHRLGLTGTPVENNLGELWALFDAVAPGLLGESKSFARIWRTPIEKKGDPIVRDQLSRRLRPFLLRRTKAAVLAELPPRTDIVEHVTLTPAQRQIYEGVRLAMHAKVRAAIAAKGLARSRIELLEALLRLRQVCCDPRLVADARQVPRGAKVAQAGAAKLERLMEMIPALLAEGRRALIFSQFTSMLDLIAAELDAARIPYLTLTGQTRDREAMVRRFQSGEVPLFLISLKAGGSGLNLTAADTVIHYDPWWNPAVEQQATDRAHRMGQDKPVFVYKLIAEDTVEVKMQLLKDRKQALADGLYDPDGATAFDIDESDVEALLGEV